MHNIQKLTKDLFWIGGNDRQISLFENVYPLNNGVSYNSYVLKDDKCVILDTVDRSIQGKYLENLEYVLQDRTPNYLIVNHMEPDHAYVIETICNKYPEIQIVCNTKTKTMIANFFNAELAEKTILVKEGDTLETGHHTLTFVTAPMVHWPEVMVTYDITDKILFSADAFGTFGALCGTVFSDDLNLESQWLPEARRYYTNIVGKYGTQVKALLKKASDLEIKMICPLHGFVIRENINWFIEKYSKWANYEAEENAVLILSGSIYGNSENCAEVLASKLYQNGVKNIKLYDVSRTHSSYLVAEAFRCSHIVIAAASYNAGIYTPVANLLNDFKAHNLQNKKLSIIENGSWAPCVYSQIEKLVAEMKNIEIIAPKISLTSKLKNTQIEELNELAKNIATSINNN